MKNRKLILLTGYIFLIIILILFQDALSGIMGQSIGMLAVALTFPALYYLMSFLSNHKRELFMYVLNTAIFITVYFIFWFKSDYITPQYYITGMIIGLILILIVNYGFPDGKRTGLIINSE